MPISPNVQAYMQQGQQPQEASSAEQIFAKSFSDQAFTSLKAKFPSLLSSVVTFKTLSSDVEHGDAVGAFILVAGDEVRYIPVTMTAGNMGSNCEMLYDKESDLFEPLSEASVKRFLSKTLVSDPQLLRKQTRVEDTRPIFQNMIRPPQSSNVLLASSRDGLSALPNSAKQVMADHFMSNPELLAKIAEFYPVEHLASKLAKTAETLAVAQDIPEVVKISDLTKEAAEKLSEEHKKEVLERGYAVIDGSEEATTIVLGLDNADADISTSLGVVEWPVKKSYQGGVPTCDTCCRYGVNNPEVRKGSVLVFTDKGFGKKPAVLSDGYMYFEGCKPLYGTCLVSAMSDDVTEQDLRTFAGAVSIEELADKVASSFEKFRGKDVRVFVPSRKGGWRAVDGFEIPWSDEYKGFTHADGVWRFKYYGDDITVTGAITHGVVRQDNSKIYPDTALFCVDAESSENKFPSPVASITSLIEIVRSMGRPIKVLRDNVDIRITDQRAEKTASFHSDADAAAYLQSEYGLKAAQIDDVLKQRSSILYKNAFDYGSLGMMPQQGPMTAPAMQGMPAMPEAPAFDPSMLADYAELEDPELMDTGILAAFADDPDIHSLLIDYTQDFLEQQDKLGRIILIFSMNKRKLEDMYGIDKLANILSSCRKIFKFIGELVANIRQYTSMAAV